MLSIPDDLYPIPPFDRISPIITEYMDETCKLFADDFPSINELSEYLSQLSSPRDAENFIEVGHSLFRLRAEKDTTVRLILLISYVEKIISSPFNNIQSWFMSKNSEVNHIFDLIGDNIRNSSNEEIKKIINSELIEKFNQKYGITNSFADFIEKNTTQDEQFRLIINFNFEKERVPINFSSRDSNSPNVNSIDELIQIGNPVQKTHVPKCYNWRMCKISSLSCLPDEGCVIKENAEEFKKTIRSLAKIIYSMRSEAVHKGSNKSIIAQRSTPTPGSSAVFSYIMVKGKSALVLLSFDELQSIFENAIKRFFDKKLIIY